MPPRRRGPRDPPDSMKTSPQTSRRGRARRGGRPRRPQRSRQERAGDTAGRRRAAHGWNRSVLAPTNSRRLAAKSRAPNGAFFNSLLVPSPTEPERPQEAPEPFTDGPPALPARLPLG